MQSWLLGGEPQWYSSRVAGHCHTTAAADFLLKGLCLETSAYCQLMFVLFDFFTNDLKKKTKASFPFPVMLAGSCDCVGTDRLPAVLREAVGIRAGDPDLLGLWHSRGARPSLAHLGNTDGLWMCVASGGRTLGGSGECGQSGPAKELPGSRGGAWVD